LTVATFAKFKKAYTKFAPMRDSKYALQVPPFNEHCFDWTLTLDRVARVASTYSMIEFGAGLDTCASTARDNSNFITNK